MTAEECDLDPMDLEVDGATEAWLRSLEEEKRLVEALPLGFVTSLLLGPP